MSTDQLKREEKRLFDTYNWRAKPEVKIDHLKKLIDVISQLSKKENVPNAAKRHSLQNYENKG